MQWCQDCGEREMGFKRVRSVHPGECELCHRVRPDCSGTHSQDCHKVWGINWYQNPVSNAEYAEAMREKRKRKAAEGLAQQGPRPKEPTAQFDRLQIVPLDPLTTVMSQMARRAAKRQSQSDDQEA